MFLKKNYFLEKSSFKFEKTWNTNVYPVLKLSMILLTVKRYLTTQPKFLRCSNFDVCCQLWTHFYIISFKLFFLSWKWWTLVAWWFEVFYSTNLRWSSSSSASSPSPSPPSLSPSTSARPTRSRTRITSAGILYFSESRSWNSAFNHREVVMVILLNRRIWIRSPVQMNRKEKLHPYPFQSRPSSWKTSGSCRRLAKRPQKIQFLHAEKSESANSDDICQDTRVKKYFSPSRFQDTAWSTTTGTSVSSSKVRKCCSQTWTPVFLPTIVAVTFSSRTRQFYHWNHIHKMKLLLLVKKLLF